MQQNIITKISPLPRMILFELLYKGFIWIVIQVLFPLILDITLTTSGYQLAFNDFMIGFLFTIPGMIAAVIMIVVSVILTYIEFSVLILISGYGLQGRRPGVQFLLHETKEALSELKYPSTIFFCIYVLGLLPMIGMGFASSLLPSFSIPNFITGELQKNAWGGYLLLVAAVIIFVLFLVSLFTMPVMILQRISFGKAFQEGLHFTRKCGKRILGTYLGYFTVWGLLSGLPVFIFTKIFGTASITYRKIFSVFGLSWQMIVLVVLLLLFQIAQLVLLPFLLHFIIERYMTAGGEAELPSVLPEKEVRQFNWKALRSLKIPKIPRIAKWILTLAGLLILGIGVVRIFEDSTRLHPPIVVGHRGSAYGVENTLEAIDAAIEEGVDYVEVDILLSADNIPMVIHDSNLSRLTGQNVNVYDLTASEIKQLNLQQNGYTGTIPTLEEAIQYCQGKIGMAVEIKLHGQEREDVVTKTMEVLEAYDYLDQCIFISLEYELIEDINTRYPQAVAGYCVYANVGNLKASVLLDMEIDFVVIEESMASKSTFDDLRRGWLPAYVWTVNDEADMQRYLELGAIGIVTDYPDIGKKVVDEYNLTSDAVYLDESEWKE